MLLLFTALLSFVSALDCSNKASWGCDTIKDTETECYGAAGKFCGVCKPECQDGGDGGEAKETPAPVVCDPKETTCKVCTSDMDCQGKLFSITTYGEGKNGRFGCTYAEEYEYVNESEECPRGSVIVQKDSECKSGDDFVGVYSTKEKCADAVAAQGGRFFIYGKSWKKGGCYKENMETTECAAGWEKDNFDVWQNIVCEDDEEAVQKEMYDDNANCKNTIATYASYGMDLCAPDSEFVGKCCKTCSEELAVGDMCTSFCSYEGLTDKQKEKCEATWCEAEKALGDAVCEDDLEAVRAAMYDDRATCSEVISSYKGWGVDVCEAGHWMGFSKSCCATCAIQAAEETQIGSAWEELSYAAITSGTCEEAGMETIKQANACEVAVSRLAEGSFGGAITTTSMYNGCFYSAKKGKSYLTTDKMSKKYKPSDPKSRFFYPSANKERRSAEPNKITYYCIEDDVSALANANAAPGQSFGVVEGFAVVGLGALLYGAFKHYTK